MSFEPSAFSYELIRIPYGHVISLYVVLATHSGLLYIYLCFILISGTLPTPSFYGGDKVTHGIEYAILGFLLARSIFSSNTSFSNGVLIIFVVALATLYGISDEIHQAFVLERSASSWDVLADVVGSYIGVICFSKISVGNK